MLAGAAHFDRPDLVARLQAAETRLQGSELAVVIVGEFKKGKSSLVNAICGFDVCPVDEVMATSVPTVVRYGAVARATVTTRSPEDPPESGVTRELPLSDLDAFISERPNDASAPIVEKVEIEVPSPLLATGITLIDTPGVGGLDSAAAVTALTALRWAEAVLFVTDATQELTAPELEYLVQVKDQCPNVTCIMTKVDLFGEWRRIAELDRNHLRSHGLDVPILELSSVLERLGAKAKDTELQAESGFPALRRYLDEKVIGPADQVAANAAARDVLFVLDQLTTQLSLQLEALVDPNRVGQLALQFEEARQGALALREQSARWQITLGDGIQDLTAGVENDVTRRIRAVILAGEQVIDNNDPMEIWDEFEPWLRKRVVQVAVENDAYLRERTAELVSKVVEHFTIPGLSAIEPADLARLALAELDRAAPTDQVMNDTRLEGLQQRGLTNLLAATRTGFSGTGIIAGIFHLAQVPMLAGAAATGVAGLAVGLVAVASIGLGRKVFGDMNRSEIAQRRAKAHMVFRRYVEEASFVLVKDARESLRLAQRTLRDQFTSFAKELEQSAGSAVLAAEQARHTGEDDRTTRLPELQAQLNRIIEVRAHVATLAGLKV